MTQMNVPWIGSDTSINVMIDGRMHPVDNTHPNFEDLKQALKKDTHDLNEIRSLVTVANYIEGKVYGMVTVADDGVYYRNKKVHGHLADRLMKMVTEGFNPEPWGLFMDRLMKNPSKTAQEELYIFLEAANLPITPDGYFLAFKKVQQNYKDIYTGTFDNSVGANPTMKREDCDPNRDNTCSRGLHFCSQSYLNMYSSGERTMIVKVDPKDVVSIPKDHNNAKGRACQYIVVGEVDGENLTVESVGEKQVKQVGNVSDDVGKPKGMKKVKPKVRTAETAFKDIWFNKDTLSGAEIIKEVELYGVTQAASYFDVARSTLHGWYKKAKEHHKKKQQTFGPTQLTAEDLKTAVEVEGSVSAAARHLGLAKSTLQGWLKKIG